MVGGTGIEPVAPARVENCPRAPDRLVPNIDYPGIVVDADRSFGLCKRNVNCVELENYRYRSEEMMRDTIRLISVYVPPLDE